MTAGRRRLALFAPLLAVVAFLAVIGVGGGDDPYRVRLHLDNASGLRDGSDVVSGGVKIGQVRVDVDDRDRVVVDLEIDEQHAPLGRDVRATIAAANFLGRKRVELVPGDRSRPAAEGSVIPVSRITTSTDLDQVLDVLDADTRTRLSIFINELGAAATGRRDDFNALLDVLPRSVTKAQTLLDELVSDNHTLASTLAHSDRVVARVTAERRSLSRLVDELGRAAGPVADRHQQLRRTLAAAPGTLEALQRFLVDLRRTTVPLGPAARAITASAPGLTSTLRELDPFRRSADPALRTATGLAPSLTRLATKATPVLRRTAPVLEDVAGLSRELVPVTDTLDRSVDNLLAIVENWTRAIQFRDGLSHVFRGEAVVSPELIRSLVERLGISLEPPAKQQRNRSRRPGAPAPKPAAAEPAPKASAPPRPRQPELPVVGDVVDGVAETVDALTDKLAGALEGLSGTGGRTERDADLSSVLDYLLGKR